MLFSPILVMATTEELTRKTLEEACAAVCRVSAHANGDKALGMYLDIMEEIQKTLSQRRSRKPDRPLHGHQPGPRGQD